jgi:hypothetical protein
MAALSAPHLSSLATALQLQEPDTVLISQEGEQLATHRALLCLRSPSLAALLAALGPPGPLAHLSLPLPAGQLALMVREAGEGRVGPDLLDWDGRPVDNKQQAKDTKFTSGSSMPLIKGILR